MVKIKKSLTFFIFFLAVACFAVNGFAQSSFRKTMEEEGLTLKDLVDVTQYYYAKPQPNKLISAIKALILQEDFINNKEYFSRFGHFVATVAYHNPQFLDRLKGMVVLHLDIRKSFLQNVINEAQAFQSPSPDTKNDLDYLWAEFLATGDDELVMKIISVLNRLPTEENAELLTWAEFTLTASAVQHTKVYEIVKRTSVSASGQIKEKLIEILNNSQEGYKEGLGKYGFVDEGYFSEKMERIDELIETDPEDARNYLSRGISNANNLNLDQALEDFQKALALNPNLPIANNYVCYIYINKGEFDKAEAHCKKAIEQSPNFSKPYFNLARIYQDRKDYEKAIDAITKTITFEPNSFEAYLFRAELFDETGEYEKALSDLEKAKKLNFKGRDYIESLINRIQRKITK